KFDVHDPPNRNNAQHHQHAGNCDKLLAYGILKKYSPISGIDKIHTDKHHEWHCDQDPSSHSALGGADSHFTGHAHAFADHMRSLVQDLRQVTSGLLLHKNGGNQELQIGDRHATAQIYHRLPERQSETLLVGGPAKLGT